MEIRLQRLGTRAFAVIGDDGNTNFGIVRGDDGRVADRCRYSAHG
jgi:hypothetical protein